MIAELRPLVTNAVPVLHNLASPQTDLHEFFVALDRVVRRARSGGRAAGELLRLLDKFFTDWASVLALDRSSDRRRPGLARTGDLLAARTRRKFYENATEFMHLLRPSAKPLVTVAPATRARLQGGGHQPRAATALNTAAGRILRRRSQNSAQTRSPPSASKTSPTRSKSATRCSPGSPRAGQLQLLDARLPQPREPRAENIGVGTLARAGFCSSPNGPNNEGFPASAPANGPSVERRLPQHARSSTTTTCTRTCTRTSPGPASRRSAKRATRSTSRARR